MNFLILILLVNFLAIFAQEKYKQQRKLLPNGGLTLYWGVEYGRFYFKTVSKTSKHVLLLFSYNDVPTDGILTGLDDNQKPFMRDLHLDFAGGLDINFVEGRCTNYFQHYFRLSRKCVQFST